MSLYLRLIIRLTFKSDLDLIGRFLENQVPKKFAVDQVGLDCFR